MAKKSTKSTVKKAVKAVKTAAPKKSKPVGASIEKTSESILKKLQALNVEHGLQADIQWCLGSYRFDKNPSGLYVMAEKAISVLKTIAEKNPKSIPAKLISEAEKALKKR